MPPLRHERLAWTSGQLLIGIDEVGRGPLAGPVVAAAVCFPLHHRGIRGVRDSKQVPDHDERARLVRQIRHQAAAFGLGAASVREIARDNIRRATATAMRRALMRCRARLAPGTLTVVLLDGLRMPELGAEHRALVRGDSHCHAIAAASLLAKVARDRLMMALAARRPGYGWQTNVGYATREHVAALRVHGLTPHHRALFCDTALGR
ncbi:MAG: ribonuclease HII [Gemmatimonadales bacterium]